MKKKIIKKEDITKIVEREVSENEIKKNNKIYKRNKLVLYSIPLVLVIINAIIYLLTNNNIFLIIFGITLFILLFGWDGNSRTCTKCKKWNSLIWIKNKNIIKVHYKNTKNIFGKLQEKAKEERLNQKEGKCINCGNIERIEKRRII